MPKEFAKETDLSTEYCQKQSRPQNSSLTQIGQMIDYINAFAGGQAPRIPVPIFNAIRRGYKFKLVCFYFLIKAQAIPIGKEEKVLIMSGLASLKRIFKMF